MTGPQIVFRRTFGLDYAVNRYYSSGLGRFMSPDPYRATTGSVNNPANPLSWNRYAYVLGDPVNLYDPRGTQAEGPRFVCEDDGEGINCWWEEPDPGPGGPSCVAGLNCPAPEPDPSWPDDHPCDARDPTNARILDFISAHRQDATSIAKRLGISVEDVLGVAAEETLYGTKGIVLDTNNYFGLHVNGPSDLGHFENQTGVFKTTGNPPAYVAKFSKMSGFLDSANAFASIESQYIQGLSDPSKLAAMLHEHGYGTTNTNYTSELTGAISNIKNRLDCK